MPSVVLAEMLSPHLDLDEGVRACVEASVLEVNGRGDAAEGVDHVVVALTDRCLRTFTWRGSAPEPDAAVPLGLVDHARADGAGSGATLTIGLSTGAVVRFAVEPAQVDAARTLAAAACAPGHTTEEIPVVGVAVRPRVSRAEAASAVRLAAEIAALCERNHDRIPELAPGLVVTADGDSATTYFVHLALPSRPQGTCPRCEHPNRECAVFCDACGALL